MTITTTRREYDQDATGRDVTSVAFVGATISMEESHTRGHFHMDADFSEGGVAYSAHVWNAEEQKTQRVYFGEACSTCYCCRDTRAAILACCEIDATPEVIELARQYDKRVACEGAEEERVESESAPDKGRLALAFSGKGEGNVGKVFWLQEQAGYGYNAPSILRVGIALTDVRDEKGKNVDSAWLNGATLVALPEDFVQCWAGSELRGSAPAWAAVVLGILGAEAKREPIFTFLERLTADEDRMTCFVTAVTALELLLVSGLDEKAMAKAKLDLWTRTTLALRALLPAGRIERAAALQAQTDAAAAREEAREEARTAKEAARVAREAEKARKAEEKSLKDAEKAAKAAARAAKAAAKTSHAVTVCS